MSAPPRASEPDEEQRPSRGLLLWLSSYLRPHAGRLLSGLALTALNTLAFLAGPMLIRNAVDVDLAHRDMHGLTLTALLYLGAQGLFLLTASRQRVLLESIGQECLRAVKSAIFSHLLRLPMRFHDVHSPGSLIARLEGDAEELRRLFSFAMVTLLSEFVRFAGTLAVMLSASLPLTLLLCAFFPLIILDARYYDRHARPLFARARDTAAAISAFVAERLEGLPVLQAFGSTDACRAEMEKLNTAKLDVEYSALRLDILFFNLLSLVEVLSLCALMWFGGRWMMQGTVTAGTLIMFLELLRRFYLPLHNLSEQYSSIRRSFASAERIRTLLAEEPDPGETGARERTKREPPAGDGLGPPAVEFRGVSFCYEPSKPVLHDISFSIPRGGRWALVGSTAAGKTTLSHLLLRFYTPLVGAVLVNGEDLGALPDEELRRTIALVPQDLVVFPCTMRENLDPEGLLSDEELYGKLSALGGDSLSELSRRSPQDARLLSTGERQLLSFARAMVQAPEILVLDEATSSLDPEAEARIRTAMARLMEGRTSLVIAHRLSTVRDADRILVLEGGRIAESGTHEELLAQGGRYHRLWALFEGTI